MRDEPGDRVRQYTELIRRLFEEAMEAGDILPGEINIIIAAVSVPNDPNKETQDTWKHDIREPVSEQYEHESMVTITADLPGTVPGDIRFAIYQDVLYLVAQAENVIYRAAYPIEGAVPNSLTNTYKNGVIEFTYKKEDREDDEVQFDGVTEYEE